MKKNPKTILSITRALHALRWVLRAVPKDSADADNARVTFLDDCVWGGDSFRTHYARVGLDDEFVPMRGVTASRDSVAALVVLLDAIAKIDERALVKLDGLIVEIAYTNEPVTFELDRHHFGAPETVPEMPVADHAPQLDAKVPVAGDHLADALAWKAGSWNASLRGHGADAPVRVDIFEGEALVATAILLPEGQSMERPENPKQRTIEFGEATPRT